MSIDLGNSIVNALIQELSDMRQGVMQLSSDLRSKVDPLSREKAAIYITRLRNDVQQLVARHEALSIVSSQINRGELLDLVEAQLNATDELLDYIESALQTTEGIEPVKLSDDIPDISGIGLPRVNEETAVLSPTESPRAAPVTSALPPRTPARSNLNGFAMVTPARSVQPKRKNDSLPPTPKLADFGLSDLSLAKISNAGQAFVKNIRMENSGILNENSEVGSNNFSTSFANHVLHEDTSPAADDDANDMTYDETISKQMQRMRLRPWELDD